MENIVRKSPLFQGPEKSGLCGKELICTKFKLYAISCFEKVPYYFVVFNSLPHNPDF